MYMNTKDKVMYVYIATNRAKTSFYIGVTSNLAKRIWQHKHKYFKGSFSERYNTDILVYYETFSDTTSAFGREDKLKHYRPEWKIELISKYNPTWRDLYEDIR